MPATVSERREVSTTPASTATTSIVNNGQTVRVIEYGLQGSATPTQDSYRLVTNLLDPADPPALELAGLYHERWEIEGVFDEFKMRCWPRLLAAMDRRVLSTLLDCRRLQGRHVVGGFDVQLDACRNAPDLTRPAHSALTVDDSQDAPRA